MAGYPSCSRVSTARMSTRTLRTVSPPDLRRILPARSGSPGLSTVDGSSCENEISHGFGLWRFALHRELHRLVIHLLRAILQLLQLRLGRALLAQHFLEARNRIVPLPFHRFL